MLPVEEQMAAEIQGLKRRVARLETLEDAGCLALIEDITTANFVIPFDDIPQNFKHLWLWITAEADAANGLTLEMTFNDHVGASYDWERMENATLFSGANDTKIKLGGTLTDQWVAHEINIFDYVDPQSGNIRAIWKGARTRGAEPCVECTIIQGGALWNEPEDVTSIQITSTAGAFGAMRATLYGLC